MTKMGIVPDGVDEQSRIVIQPPPKLHFFEARSFRDDATVPLDTNRLVSDYRHHYQMIANSSDSNALKIPLSYLRVYKGAARIPSKNSADSTRVSMADDYLKIENQLLKLSNADENERVVEKAAADTALTVIDHLKGLDFYPPALSWHGGDAVVMLWALGSTTYAITVTDGEIGYVVRRDKRELKVVDSIRVDTFKLSDMR